MSISEGVIPTPRALALPQGVVTVSSLHCSSESTLLLGEDNSLWAAGWNEHGNLGLGDTKDRSGWARVALPSVGPWSVTAGGAHVLAVDPNVEPPLVATK